MKSVKLLSKLFITLQKNIVFVLTLVPIIFLIVSVMKYHVNIPFVDAWEFIPLLEKSYTGALTFDDFWVQHNEHRPLFSRIILLVLARLTSWNTAYEVGVNTLLGIMVFVVVVWQLQTLRSKSRNIIWLIPIVSVLIFSLNQFENWLFGWTMHIFLNVLAVVTGIKLLTTPNAKWKKMLEMLASFGLISRQEIGDHKEYFSKKSIIHKLTEVGFKQNNIKIKYYPFPFLADFVILIKATK